MWWIRSKNEWQQAHTQCGKNNANVKSQLKIFDYKSALSLSENFDRIWWD